MNNNQINIMYAFEKAYNTLNADLIESSLSESVIYGTSYGNCGDIFTNKDAFLKWLKYNFRNVANAGTVKMKVEVIKNIDGVVMNTLRINEYIFKSPAPIISYLIISFDGDKVSKVFLTDMSDENVLRIKTLTSAEIDEIINEIMGNPF